MEQAQRLIEPKMKDETSDLRKKLETRIRDWSQAQKNLQAFFSYQNVISYEEQYTSTVDKNKRTRL